jgi:hypothetical protein
MIMLHLGGVTVTPVMSPKSRQRLVPLVAAEVTDTHAGYALVSRQRAQQSRQLSTVKGAPALVVPLKDPLNESPQPRQSLRSHASIGEECQVSGPRQVEQLFGVNVVNVNRCLWNA